MSTSNDRKTTPPQRYTMRPISIAVTAVSEMPIVVTKMESDRIIDIKCTPEMARVLYELLGKHLAKEKEDLICFTLRGLSR